MSDEQSRAREQSLISSLAGVVAFPAYVRSFEKRLGTSALPVGIALSTEEVVLLAENGDIVLGGDAGVQRVWDMTFF
ncbi:hypothetical protein [Streptomyces sp. NPDC096030]|uniref:hypothetical protein n=1 Tax=Streptomyces sp. NPDC096030 TaxID=3155423 RepID=UPI003330221E